ncbi:MAG TPA: hypothetical protein VL173_17420 [Vicinamibacterales bacterium]|nr:hypothetical protein [Vicinamibacterales bacterium]
MVGALYAAEGTPAGALEAVAREFSPRIEVCGSPSAGERREVTLDLSGVERLFGNGHDIAAAIRATAADRDLRVRVAIAGTRTAARLLVHFRAGVTVIEPGTEASSLAPLPLALLAVLRTNDSNDSNASNELLLTLRRWGLRTLGEFVALPPADVAARLGQEGVRWQRLAAGDDPLPLVPSVPEERFEQALDLEWPIDGLEPLSFVLGRLMEPLERHLERRDRGAAVLHLRLHLVKNTDGTRPVHERTLQLPTPIRDARTLRTLALLDLESHPPAAAIDRVVVAVDPTPARIVQYSLITRPLPSPEQISTLMARLHALMGDGRCGAPATVDSWQPGAFALRPFAPNVNDLNDANDSNNSSAPILAVRRFRLPIPARVHVDAGKPARVTTDRRGLGGGRVEQCAGPWRTSGVWWEESDREWDRDEWDVTLADGATYRVFRERDSNHWFLEGVID